jgi:hypothetical protein
MPASVWSVIRPRNGEPPYLAIELTVAPEYWPFYTYPWHHKGGSETPSHGENRGSSPLGSATSFAQSFTFKALAARLCKWGAMFV